MSLFWRNVFMLGSFVYLSSCVSGWVLDLRQFGSCTAHLVLFPSSRSQKYFDWATNLISTNPHMLWTVTTKHPLPESVTLSINSKRSLCTLNILMMDKEGEENALLNYAVMSVNTLRPHMHSTCISIREDNNRIPELKNKMQLDVFPFRVIFTVISHDEESLSFYYFCPLCKSPIHPVHNTQQLSTLSNKQFRYDWGPLIVGVTQEFMGPSKGISDKRCLEHPSESQCLPLAKMELLSHHLNFTIFYASTDHVSCHMDGGCILVTIPIHTFSNRSVTLKTTVHNWFFKFEGSSLFYCIPRNTTNKLQQEGIQTWVMVFETKFWAAFIILLFLATLAYSFSLQITPFQTVKIFGDKCFYMLSALTRQEIPSNEKAIWIFSFLVSLVLFIYENEFTCYVIVEMEPPPYRSSGEVIENNYKVFFHWDNSSYEGSQKELEELKTRQKLLRLVQIQNQLLNSGLLKSKNQFESRSVETNGSALSLNNAIRVARISSALLEKGAALDSITNSVALKTPLPVIAEWTHKMNWMDSDSVCYVTERDVIINPILWLPIVHFKYELLKIVNIFEQSGLENHWWRRFFDHESNEMNKASRKGDYLGLKLTPHKRESGLVSMKQLKSMVMLCVGLMGLGWVILVLEVVIGRPKEVLDFLYYLYCKIWIFFIRIIVLSQAIKRSWVKVMGRNKHLKVEKLKRVVANK